MALSVDRPLRAMGDALVAWVHVTPFPSAVVSSSHDQIQTETGANPDVPAEDDGAPQGASPVRCCIFMFAHGRGPKDYQFIIDSGASVHATGRYFLLKDLLAVTAGGSARVANGRELRVCGRGRVFLDNFTLDDVNYIPGLVANIVSVSKLVDLDYDVQFKGPWCFIRDTRAGDALVGKGCNVNGMFVLDYLFVPAGRRAAATPW